MARQTRKSLPKKVKRKVPKGIVHIQASFNNTIITITNLKGEVISWSSAGACGFKGARKGTPFAAKTAAETAARESLDQGMKPQAPADDQEITSPFRLVIVIMVLLKLA